MRTFAAAELVAVRLELTLVPAGTDTPVEPTAGDHVDRRGDLGEQTRVRYGVQLTICPSRIARGALADRGHRRPALEHGFVRGHGHVVEVVVDPDRVVTQVLGQRRDLDGSAHLSCGSRDGRQLHLPTLGNERAELDRMCSHEPHASHAQ